MFVTQDFNVVITDTNGHFIRIEELNEMIKVGAIIIDRDKLDAYKNETRTIDITRDCRKCVYCRIQMANNGRGYRIVCSKGTRASIECLMDSRRHFTTV